MPILVNASHAWSGNRHSPDPEVSLSPYKTAILTEYTSFCQVIASNKQQKGMHTILRCGLVRCRFGFCNLQPSTSNLPSPGTVTQQRTILSSMATGCAASSLKPGWASCLSRTRQCGHRRVGAAGGVWTAGCGGLSVDDNNFNRDRRQFLRTSIPSTPPSPSTLPLSLHTLSHLR